LTLPVREAAPSGHDHTDQHPHRPAARHGPRLPRRARGPRRRRRAARLHAHRRGRRRRHDLPGTDEIRGFLSRAGAEFTYTTELVGAQRVDDERWVVTNRLEGDFPGGVAELRYRFAMDGDLIAELVIAP
jgi:hypothetical protein